MSGVSYKMDTRLALILIAVAFAIGTVVPRRDHYVPGPGPELDPQVPIRVKSFAALSAFFGTGKGNQL